MWIDFFFHYIVLQTNELLNERTKNKAHKEMEREREKKKSSNRNAVYCLQPFNKSPLNFSHVHSVVLFLRFFPFSLTRIQKNPFYAMMPLYCHVTASSVVLFTIFHSTKLMYVCGVCIKNHTE